MFFGLHFLSITLERNFLNAREEKKLNNGLQLVSLLLLLVEKKAAIVIWKLEKPRFSRVLQIHLNFQQSISAKKKNAWKNGEILDEILMRGDTIAFTWPPVTDIL